MEAQHEERNHGNSFICKTDYDTLDLCNKYTISSTLPSTHKSHVNTPMAKSRIAVNLYDFPLDLQRSSAESTNHITIYTDASKGSHLFSLSFQWLKILSPRLNARHYIPPPNAGPRSEMTMRVFETIFVMAKNRGRHQQKARSLIKNNGFRVDDQPFWTSKPPVPTGFWARLKIITEFSFFPLVHSFSFFSFSFSLNRWLSRFCSLKCVTTPRVPLVR